MVNNIITLENVWKIYQMGEVRVSALRDVSVDIGEGEFVAITGVSGSGKSTMMHLVGSLDIPSKGKVFLDGHDISKLSESDLAQVRGRKIGFIFQQFNLIPTLTALENVMLPMDLQDEDENVAKKRATDLLKSVDLGDRLDHYPSQLSGGEQQRVAVARSLANDPPVILADEPTGNLDSKSGSNVMQLLENLWKDKGKTVIMVTHDLKIANKAKRRIELKDGQIIRGGK